MPEIERLPWYKTVHPNRKIYSTDKQYVTAWLAILIRQWGEN
jgi:hypothetical protein